MSLPESLQSEGGPAFPCSNDEDKVYNWLHAGMSLRDWFAGKAMQAIVDKIPLGRFDPKEWSARVAAESYEIAEAMIKERERV